MKPFAENGAQSGVLVSVRLLDVHEALSAGREAALECLEAQG